MFKKVYSCSVYGRLLGVALHCHMPKHNEGLHIEVGHAVDPGGDLNLENELRLIKSAILYGDQVTLHSMKSESLIMAREIVRNWSFPLDTSRLRKIIHESEFQLLDQLEKATQQLVYYKSMLASYGRSMTAQKRKIDPDYQRMAQLFRQMEKEFSSYKKEVYNMFADTGVEELVEALNVRGFKLSRYESLIGERTFADVYIENVFSLVSSGNNYPMFDETTSNLIRLALKEGVTRASTSSVKRGKQIGLSTDFIKRLPNFDSASIKEVIDIRSALAKPLVRFRSAMTAYSKDTSSAAWDDDFPYEADELFSEKIAPAILEIEEAVADNNIFKNLTKNVLFKTAQTGILTVGMANVSFITDHIGKSGGEMLGGLVSLGVAALEEHQISKRKIEQNQMYFLYRANKLLN